MATTKLSCCLLIISLIFTTVVRIDAAPRPPPSSHHPIPGASENEIEEDVNEIHDDDKVDKEMDDLGLEYGRYLQEIVKALDDDPVFSKKLENVTHEQIMNGHVARIIDQVAPDVRNRLDELKRIELERLRKLTMKEHKLEEEMEEEQKRRDDDSIASHIDHQNPHTFEAEDLQKLILQATKDLDELDKKRRRDFKQYEMEKELHYREQLQNMTSEQKTEAERKHEEIKRKHQEHPKVHHPGSRQQLEQVWEEQDHMPRQEFDPKLFFQMHDINGDGFLDQEEVEAILTVEVKKLYNEKDPSYDRNEMIEEYHRMREHIYKEIDSNHDGLISKKEFLDYSHKEEFNRDEGWKGIEEAPVYTEEELKRYEHERRQLQEHYARYGLPQQYQQQQQYAYQPVYYQVVDPNHPQAQQQQQQQQHHQVYVVNAPPEHIQQPVQYQHVQLPPQNYQHQVVQQQQHPGQITGQQQPQQQQQYHQPQIQNQQQQQPPQHVQQPNYGQAPVQNQPGHVAIQMSPPQQQQHQGQPMPNHPNTVPIQPQAPQQQQQHYNAQPVQYQQQQHPPPPPQQQQHHVQAPPPPPKHN